MKAKRYTQEKIIGILKAHESGAEVTDLVGEHGISEQSFYRWKSKYGGMEVAEARRLKELEVENARLKRLLAKAELDKTILKDIVAKSAKAGRAQAPGRPYPGKLSYQLAPGLWTSQHRSQDLPDARQIIDGFRAHYNEIQTHSSLNYQPPAVFARKAA